MEGGRVLRNSQIIILGVCIACATVASSVILSQGFLKVMKFTKEVINVTGSAQKMIRSDYTSWQVAFSRQLPDLTAAYQLLKDDLERVKSYLLSKGVRESEMVVSQVFMTTLFKQNEKGYDTNEIEGYRLSQNITVNSYDVNKVTALSRGCTEMIHEGVGLNSSPPQYFYTKLDDLKVEMLGLATQNARQRARQMAASAGNRIGAIRAAKMGVFQITPPTSTDVSDYGYNDTSSLEKKVMAVVSATFAIE